MTDTKTTFKNISKNVVGNDNIGRFLENIISGIFNSCVF